MLVFVAVLLSLALLIMILYPVSLMPARRKHRNTDEIKKYRYAHRGFFSREKNIPENSLTAFSAAIDNGYGFELDLHLTADKKLVVIHDTSLKRTAGADISVCDVTYGEISAYLLEKTDEKIPLFEDVLELNAGKVPMVIELKVDKGNAKELVEYTLRALEGYTGLYCIESFYPDALIALKKSAPEIMRGQLSCDVRREDKCFSRIKNFVLKNLLTNFLTKPDFIAYAHEDRDLFSFSLCKELYRPCVFYWTVRDKDTLCIAEKEGAGVIFDSFDPSEK
ncbi:MAG: glycerophosphodiester phosphodiesterase [Ruminococcaceae bacterium]|nr:glycerophosphodiester phosphodiesterase [Oscillospiraceae bacterium]